MVAQPDALDEIQVGVEDFLWCVSVEHTDEQGDDAFHDEGVALCREHDFAIHKVGLQPHTALATVNQVALCLVPLVERWLLVAQVDEQLVFVHPVGEVGEFFDHLVLQFVDCHDVMLVFVFFLLICR